MNCWVVPGATDGFDGVMEIETSDGFTVRVREPATAPIFAVMVHAPAVFAASIPPAATEATFALDELQVTDPVKSLGLPLLYVPVAVICWIWPAVMVALGVVTCTETSAGGLVGVCVPPPQPSRRTRTPNTAVSDRLRIETPFLSVVNSMLQKGQIDGQSSAYNAFNMSSLRSCEIDGEDPERKIFASSGRVLHTLPKGILSVAEPRVKFECRNDGSTVFIQTWGDARKLT